MAYIESLLPVDPVNEMQKHSIHGGTRTIRTGYIEQVSDAKPLADLFDKNVEGDLWAVAFKPTDEEGWEFLIFPNRTSAQSSQTKMLEGMKTSKDAKAKAEKAEKAAAAKAKK